MTVRLDVELLDEFARRLRMHGVPAIDAAQAGKSDSEMQALVAQVGLTLPYEARVWWGWRDGVPPSAGVDAAIGLFRWLPLEEAVEDCLRIRNLIAATAEDDSRHTEGRWASSWLPLVSGGGSVVIDTDVPEGSPCPVRAYWFDEPDAPPDLGSLGELVRLWIEALDRGVWRYDSSAGWKIDQNMRDDWSAAKRGLV